ncbi:succinate-semialdehyde dehydrogenase [Metarhizium album ARSEF 1941]|uniref:Succinate-semialdehyde dehydrogenase n=1 Tax=Metarhizium album (strain ARSEF 1941) TaxID=1081103 RepID=A0A0B2WYT5_METAS|nr:succinate-semialdehyde dehydrogenase [Metarhizium album ARSEF 1941]KHN98729.1 succinate-semialdehyde dehydrogenase [Metarhizium album ARSEF 1941]
MTAELPFQLANKSLANPYCLVDGQDMSAKSGKRYDVIDPGTGRPWTSCPDCGSEDVDAAVQSSRRAFLEYSKWTPRKRAQTMSRWHQLIVAAREDLAKILVHETGKPLAEAYGEVDYAASFAWWFVGEAERAHGSSIVSAVPGRRAITIKQPIGVAAALVPWNFPVALTLRKMAAALAAGCTMVVKPSPETPLTAGAVARLGLEAGFPVGTLNVLTTSLDNTPSVAESLCLHPLVHKVTFTGSTRVGKIITSLCAPNLKKFTLELGGNCPFIVFDDANIDQALSQLMALKWRHAGQACISSNRLYVQRGVYASFVDELVHRTSLLKVGHGMAQGTTMGPVTTPRALDKAEAMAKDAIARGAKIVHGTGLRAESRAGYFMNPTILTEVTDDMLMSKDEIFAPLLGVSMFDTENEVIARANNTTMGLASYVFTKNVDRLWRMFERLEAGMIGLNTGNSSCAEAPFGGIKESGCGKESGKDVAVEEFLVTKNGTLTVEDHW